MGRGILYLSLIHIFSMDPRYESLCGITQEEMERYFHEPISELAEKDECTYEEMKERLKDVYKRQDLPHATLCLSHFIQFICILQILSGNAYIFLGQQQIEKIIDSSHGYLFGCSEIR